MLILVAHVHWILLLGRLRSVCFTGRNTQRPKDGGDCAQQAEPATDQAGTSAGFRMAGGTHGHPKSWMVYDGRSVEMDDFEVAPNPSETSVVVL